MRPKMEHLNDAPVPAAKDKGKERAAEEYVAAPVSPCCQRTQCHACRHVPRMNLLQS